ncbi:hypothetical protein ACLMJK_006183 [Lecanora helva]
MATKAEGLSTFTPRETDLLVKALQQCLKDPNGLQIDNKKFMAAGGFKSANSASASWSMIKKKLFSAAPSGDDNDSGEVNGEDKGDTKTDTKTDTKAGAKGNTKGDAATKAKSAPRKRAPKGKDKGTATVGAEVDAAIKDKEAPVAGQGTKRKSAEDAEEADEDEPETKHPRTTNSLSYSQVDGAGDYDYKQIETVRKNFNPLAVVDTHTWTAINHLPFSMGGAAANQGFTQEDVVMI